MLPVLLFIAPESGQCQYKEKSVVYEIFRGTDKIGTIVGIQITDGSKKLFRIQTHLDVRVIFSVKADIVVRNTFMDDVLTEAYAKRLVNNSVKTNNAILKQGSRYQMIDKDQDTTFYNGAIGPCVSQLYFGEPVNLTSVFSEAFLQQVPIRKSSDGIYELILPDGHMNHYTYVNGVCTAVTIETQ
ncbi:MAG: DUF6134 family protein, partial [Chitinophagales bacterium]